FESVITQNGIKKALCCSNDPIFYSLCEKNSTNIVTNDHMFHEDEVVINPMPFDGIVMDNATINELDEIMSYFTGIGMAGDWLVYYITQRINQGELILFRYNGEIIGTGETRPSISSEGYANIGMTVSTNYRRLGLGSYIISTIRNLTNERGYKAICSTDKTNIASIHTIIRSGFVCYHKVDEITF
ncbi:MAG: GNAT family N-acetyltransferase, partial [Clostridium sp.]